MDAWERQAARPGATAPHCPSCCAAESHGCCSPEGACRSPPGQGDGAARFPVVHVQLPLTTRTALHTQGEGAGTAAGIAARTAALATCNNSSLLELTEGEEVRGELSPALNLWMLIQKQSPPACRSLPALRSPCSVSTERAAPCAELCIAVCKLNLNKCFQEIS